MNHNKCKSKEKLIEEQNIQHKILIQDFFNCSLFGNKLQNTHTKTFIFLEIYAQNLSRSLYLMFW